MRREKGKEEGEEEMSEWMPVPSTTLVGKVFFYNPATKESAWELPAGARLLPNPELAPAKVDSVQNDSNRSSSNAPSNNGPTSSSSNDCHKTENSRSPLTDRERVFWQLLQTKGVMENVPWERVMRDIHLHPDYHAVANVADKRRLFARFQETLLADKLRTREQAVQAQRGDLLAWLDCMDATYEDFCSCKPSLIYASVEFRERCTFDWIDVEFDQAFGDWRRDLDRRRRDSQAANRQRCKQQLKEFLQTPASNEGWLQIKPALVRHFEEALKEHWLLPKDLLYAYEDLIAEKMAEQPSANQPDSQIIGQPVNQSVDVHWKRLEVELRLIIGVKASQDTWSQLLDKLFGLAGADEALLHLDPVDIVKFFEAVVKEHATEYRHVHRPKLLRLFSDHPRDHSHNSNKENRKLRLTWEQQLFRDWSTQTDQSHDAIYGLFRRLRDVQDVPDIYIRAFFDEYVYLRYRAHKEDVARQRERTKRLRQDIATTAVDPGVLEDLRQAFKHRLPVLWTDSTFDGCWEHIKGLPEYQRLARSMQDDAKCRQVAQACFDKYQGSLLRQRWVSAELGTPGNNDGTHMTGSRELEEGEVLPL